MRQEQRYASFEAFELLLARVGQFWSSVIVHRNDEIIEVHEEAGRFPFHAPIEEPSLETALNTARGFRFQNSCTPTPSVRVTDAEIDGRRFIGIAVVHVKVNQVLVVLPGGQGRSDIRTGSD